MSQQTTENPTKAELPPCPHCGSKHVVRNGQKVGNAQAARGLCCDCGKTMNINGSKGEAGGRRGRPNFLPINPDFWRKQAAC